MATNEERLTQLREDSSSCTDMCMWGSEDSDSDSYRGGEELSENDESLLSQLKEV